ncbi:MAG: Two-component transcriptional response regulator, LuxR family, partial [uncultured Nocardioidaceae bacterium]
GFEAPRSRRRRLTGRPRPDRRQPADGGFRGQRRRGRTGCAGPRRAGRPARGHPRRDDAEGDRLRGRCAAAGEPCHRPHSGGARHQPGTGRRSPAWPGARRRCLPHQAVRTGQAGRRGDQARHARKGAGHRM